MNNQEYIFRLREKLTLKQETSADIEAACKYAENLLQLNLPVIFDRKHFSLLVGYDISVINTMISSMESHFYRTAYIKKKNGGERELTIPAMNVKDIQRWILDNILSRLYISPVAMGFCKDKSIVTNASCHIGKSCIVNLDLKDFFPSVKIQQVFNVFYYYGYTQEVSYLLARLCTYNDYLPQGAPTSPCLSNLVCIKLDKRLMELAKRYNAEYSRYADDITFSGNSDISSILKPVTQIIEDEGFCLNQKKTRVQYRHQRQEVTGLIVNGDHVRVDKQYLKKLKQEIYYCKKYGVTSHLEHIGCNKRFYRDHLFGKIYFVNMVDPELGKRLLNSANEIIWD